VAVAARDAGPVAEAATAVHSRNEVGYMQEGCALAQLFFFIG
jgi:hypothetical protein